jgi:SAM-dependent methyltransferase
MATVTHSTELAAYPAWHCPVHKTLLQVANDELKCVSGHSFRVVGGIPRFVGDRTYADAFGLQWNRYRLTQLDSYRHTDHSARRARRCIGEELWKALAGKHMLEAGCGAGRFTEVLLAQGALVTSLDLSNAVEANAHNCPVGATHRVGQADILALPFSPRGFDLVFCLGVIQHTPNPETTIAKLFEQVKPGGTLVLDHYCHSLSAYTKTAPFVRMWLRRQSPEKGLIWTERLVRWFFPLHRAVRHSRLGHKLVSRISPLLTYFHVSPDLSDEMQYELALLDTHDSLTDFYKHRRTRGQIRRLLEQLGAQKIWCEYGGNGVEARAKRP